MLRLDFKADLSPLADLKDRKARIALRIAINRAAKPVKNAVKSAAEGIALRGYTAKSIGTKTKVYNGGSSVVVVIGPKRSYSRTKGSYTRGKRKGEKRVFVPAKVAQFVEKGTGRSRKRPFLKPALDSAGSEFKDRLAAEIKAEINK